MKSFEFPLDKVLEWRREQYDAAVAKLGRLQAELEALVRERHSLAERERTARAGVEQAPDSRGRDFHWLAGFEKLAQIRRAEFASRQTTLEAGIAAQRREILEARRRVRLIETLRARKVEEWTRELWRELETLSQESFLARWVRERNQ